MASRFDLFTNVMLIAASVIVIAAAALQMGVRSAVGPRPVPRAVEDVDGLELWLGDLPSIGSADAKLAIVEFSDFECRFCSRFARETLGQIRREFVDTGKIRYMFSDYPIADIHDFAFRAGEAAECAREQGKYLEIRDRLLANQDRLAAPDLTSHARAVGLDMSTFDACLSQGRAATLRGRIARAERAGVRSTPTFLIGQVQPGGKLRVLKRVNGARHYDTFRRVLEQLVPSAAPWPSGS